MNIRKGLLTIFGATALILGANVTPVSAQIETSVGTFSPTIAVTSNYLFRGISQNDRRPALQAGLEYGYTVGMFTPYLGTFISNVGFPDGAGGYLRQRVELDLYGGLRVTPIDNLTLDAGVIAYTYPRNSVEKLPNPQGVGNPSWTEVYGKAAYDFGFAKVVGSVFYTSAFSAASGTGWYYEGGADVPLPIWDLTASGRVGRQTVDKNANFGFPDYTTWNLGLSRSFFGILVAATYSDTNMKENAALGRDITNANSTLTKDNYKLTRNQFVLSLTKAF
ncbi:MAG: hypothetical protein J0H39_02720 [Alphaproteobacteria bacterium]|nr:hypothetical protein [Alphaproteobacteria bacterium]MBN9495644.1 hypothetical protein [Alphaproteobacteria bacterium]